MNETILFNDATAAAVAILGLAVTPPVGTRVPNPRPDEFVRVIRIGGVRRNLVVDQASLMIEAWAQTEEASQDLAQLCRAALHASVRESFAGYGMVYSVDEIGGIAYNPDPESGTDRYTFQVAIALRGQTV